MFDIKKNFELMSNDDNFTKYLLCRLLLWKWRSQNVWKWFFVESFWQTIVVNKMKVCKKLSRSKNFYKQNLLTNWKCLKNDYLMNVFSKKSLLIKWEIAKNFYRSKNFCKRSWHVEKLLQTKFINKSKITNRKLLAKKLLINKIIKTNTRTMNNKTIDKNCWSRWRKIDRQTNEIFFRTTDKKDFCKQ